MIPERELDSRYLDFFQCFNQERFFEAHEVLEGLWLLDRRGPNGDYYKGLIQLAGAFVHVQKGRPQPAAALLRLAQKNLGKYPAHHELLEVSGVLELIATWLGRVADRVPGQGQAAPAPYPKLGLLTGV